MCAQGGEGPQASASNKIAIQQVQQSIYYRGQEVIMVLTVSLECYVNLTHCCNVLELNARGQLQRIQRTPQLNEGLQQLPMRTRGGLQYSNCLKLIIVEEWLTSMHNKLLTEAVREQIETFLAILIEAEHTLRHPQPSGNVGHDTVIGGSFNAESASIIEPGIVALDLEEQSLLLTEERIPQEKTSQHFWFDQTEDLPSGPQEQRALLTTLPGVNSAPILVTTGYQEDQAIREATLARQTDWQEEPVSQRIRYIASNKLHVYLGDPEHPLGDREISTVLQALGESTILTARILLGLWNIRRDEHQLTKDGSAAIRIDDILEWRGVRKHHRAIYPGAQRHSTDGYQWKHKQQVHRDIKLLELCHLRGYRRITIKGKTRQFSIDGPYLRVMSIKETISETKDDIFGYFIAPGAWINTYEEHDDIRRIELDRRIFQLNPQNDQIALRIALYVTEQWKFNPQTGHYMDPTPMHVLLTASMIPVDRSNLTARFIPRVEEAIRTLCTMGIVNHVYPLETPDRSQTRWGKEWLLARWIFVPREDLLQRGRLEKRRL
jgi:hypothetical protein